MFSEVVGTYKIYNICVYMQACAMMLVVPMFPSK